MHSGGLEIPKCTASNPGHGLRGDWTSTRGDGFQMGGLSDRRSPLGGLLQLINSHKMYPLCKKMEELFNIDDIDDFLPR